MYKVDTIPSEPNRAKEGLAKASVSRHVIGESLSESSPIYLLKVSGICSRLGIRTANGRQRTFQQICTALCRRTQNVELSEKEANAIVDSVIPVSWVENKFVGTMNTSLKA